MFPKPVETPRGVYLLGLLKNAGDTLNSWTMPTKDDMALVGAYVVLYSYIDFNLRRLAESMEFIGRIPKVTRERRISELAEAVQSADWSPENLAALRRIEEFRKTRNLLAHQVIRRFPDDDAFAFLFKNAKDFEEHFGTKPTYGGTIAGVLERGQLVQVRAEVESLQTWLAKVTLELEESIDGASGGHKGGKSK
jgi:hypothetical protein